MGDYHPLFLPEGGDDEDAKDGIKVTEIDRIFVLRRDPSAPKGFAWAGHGGFLPDEIQEMRQISERFGGGVYKLKARGPNGYIGDRDFKIDGASRPMTDEVLVSAAAAAAPAVAAVAQSSTTLETLLAVGTALLLPIAKLWMDSSAAAATREAESTRRHSEMMIAMMNSGKEDARAFNAAQATSQTTLLKSILELKATPAPAAANATDTLGNALADHLQLSEVISQMSAKKGAADGVEGIMQSAATIASTLPHLAPLIAQIKSGLPQPPAVRQQAPQQQQAPNAPNPNLPNAT